MPNFSEGRRAGSIGRLEAAVASGGAELLDLHADPDHNRCVLTLAGPLASAAEAVLAASAVAVESIDLRTHRGTHPRIGAVDVVPITPLWATPRSACIEAAREIGERLWRDLRVPVYYYGEAASREGRRRLESVRRLGFERLGPLARDGEVRPDVGGPSLHPSAGACCVGVRPFLAAFNVQLAARDAAAARRIAGALRESAGGLPGVKALGMYLESAGVAQVSMNLTRLDLTPLDAAYDAVCAAASRLGVQVLGSEIVGLVPRAALGPAPARLRIADFGPGMILEERLEDALSGGRAGMPRGPGRARGVRQG